MAPIRNIVLPDSLGVKRKAITGSGQVNR